VEELIEEAKTLGLNPDNYVRECFQKIILYSISRLGIESYYVFQGGTALRLFYGSPRHSLDMDYTLVMRSLEESKRDSRAILSVVSRVMTPYEVSVSLTREKMLTGEGFYRYFLVFDMLKWLKRKIKIKLEIVRRSYQDIRFSRKILNIRFPMSTSIGVVVKSPSQLLADKVASLAGGYHRGYIRWRDIFDIYWLSTRSKAEIDVAYLLQEFGSFIEKPEDIASLAKEIRELLSRGDFTEIRTELERLLHRTLLEDELVREYLKTAVSILENAYAVIRDEVGGVG